MKKIAIYVIYIIWRMKLNMKKIDNTLFILCTPLHGNLGDQAILEGELNFFKTYYPNYNVVEVPANFILHDFIYKKLKKILEKAKNLFITRRRILRRCLAKK